MIYKVYKWEWDDKPGFFHGRWILAFETNNEEMFKDGIKDIDQYDNHPTPIAVFKEMEEKDREDGYWVA